MSKTIKITIDEIRAINPILRLFTGDILEVASVLDDVKKLVVTDADWIEAKLVKTPTDEQVRAQVDALPEDQKKTFQTEQRLTWDPAWEKEVSLDGAVVAYLVAKIKEKNDKKEITLNDTALISINKKLS
jgi:hypothetical protein